jgi:hypothetical protein
MYSTDYHRQFHLWAKRELDPKLVMFLNKQSTLSGDTTVTTWCLLVRRLQACEERRHMEALLAAEGIVRVQAW